MNEKMFGSGEVAKQLGVPRWKLTQMIELGKLPEASGKLEGRRLFSPADVDAIVAKYLELAEAKAAKDVARAQLGG
jgi:DNA-binding transcriptional MerR regulator